MIFFVLFIIIRKRPPIKSMKGQWKILAYSTLPKGGLLSPAEIYFSPLYNCPGNYFIHDS